MFDWMFDSEHSRYFIAPWMVTMVGLE